MAVKIPRGMGSILLDPNHTDDCGRRCGHLFGVRYRWPDPVTGKGKAKEEQNRFPNETAALARLHEVAEEKGKLKGGAHNPELDKRIPANRYIMDHMLSRTKLSQGSVRRYRFLIGKYLHTLTLPIGELHPRVMREFIAGLVRDKVPGTDISTIRSIVKAACKVAVADRIMDVNPAEGIETPRIIRAVQRREVPSVEQVRNIASAASVLGRDIIYTIAGTGCRIGELLAIDAQCLVENGRMLEIHRQWGYGDTMLDQLKSKPVGDIRQIPLDDVVYGILKSRCAGRAFAFEKEYVSEARREVYEKKADPHPMRRAEVSIELKSACRLAGEPHFTAHAFRHFYATQAFANGVPLEVVSSYLGHKKVDITLQTYIHFIAPVHNRMRDVVSGFMQSII